jgi:cation diffusion facilitator family transporter
MQGMFLHVLADTMGSVAVIISALLIDNFGWHWADPLCSLFLSLLIFASIFPVLKDSGLILLQRCPPSIETQLPTAFQKVHAVCVYIHRLLPACLYAPAYVHVCSCVCMYADVSLCACVCACRPSPRPACVCI